MYHDKCCLLVSLVQKQHYISDITVPHLHRFLELIYTSIYKAGYASLRFISFLFIKIHCLYSWKDLRKIWKDKVLFISSSACSVLQNFFRRHILETIRTISRIELQGATDNSTYILHFTSACFPFLFFLLFFIY